MAIGLWFLGFVGLLVAAAVASARGRANPHDVAGRGLFAVAAIAYVGLVAAAVWLWGGSMAREGRADRLREGATVGVTLDGVRILDTTRPLDGAQRTSTIGHGADATLRMPGDGLDVMARVELDARGIATIRATDVADGSARSARVLPVVGGGDVAARATHACANAKSNPTNGGARTNERANGANGAPMNDANGVNGVRTNDGTNGAPTNDANGSNGARTNERANGVRSNARTNDAHGANGARANGRADANGSNGAPMNDANGVRTNARTNGAPTNDANGSNGWNGARTSERTNGGRTNERTNDAHGANGIRTNDAANRAFELPLGTTVIAVECEGERAVAGLVVRRDARGVVGTPLVAERGRLVVERRTLHAGDALRIGTASDPIPNLVTWEVTAPAWTSAMLAIPLDPSECAAWDRAARPVGQGCAVAVGAFELTATPLVPDADGVLRRNVIAAIVIGAPALLLLLVVGLSARHGRKARVLGRALRVCVLGVGLVALACWRLAWAHRIDAMHEAVSRVRDNELAVIAIGAALAGCVVLALDVLEGRSLLQRIAAALLGWAAWFVGCVLLAGIQPPLTMLGIGVVGLSAIAALTPVLGDLAGRIAERIPPEIMLLAIAGAALGAKSIGARGALVKLGLAYATVLAGHAALRALLTRRGAQAGSKLRRETAGGMGGADGSGAESREAANGDVDAPRTIRDAGTDVAGEPRGEEAANGDVDATRALRRRDLDAAGTIRDRGAGTSQSHDDTASDDVHATRALRQGKPEDGRAIRDSIADQPGQDAANGDVDPTRAMSRRDLDALGIRDGGIDTASPSRDEEASVDAAATRALRRREPDAARTIRDRRDTGQSREEDAASDDVHATRALRQGKPDDGRAIRDSHAAASDGDHEAATNALRTGLGRGDAAHTGVEDGDAIADDGADKVGHHDNDSDRDDASGDHEETDEQAGDRRPLRDDKNVGIEDSLPVARWRYGLRRAAKLPPTWARDIAHRALLLGSLVAAVGAIALLDTGVTLAIVGVGLALAMLVAGHDAMYDASQSGKLGLLEREHARLLIAHGVAVAGLAVGVATAVMLASDRELLSNGTFAVLHAPLVAVGLFGIAAAIARSHRRAWAPWLAAALAALAVWGMRDAILERATAGDGVASRRVAAVVEPGYALLRDDHAFVANATAWREAAVARTNGTLNGQGYFGARIRDVGVLRSIENDYLPVLVARESGVGGLMQSVLLLLGLVVGAGAIASLRLPHASRAQRARWLLTGVGGALVVYQPLASLGILPLTGITWPGLGIDSPGDLWLFVIGLVWCLLGAEQPAGSPRTSDERVRRAPRVTRARRIVLAALVLAGIAAVVVVVRAGAVALSRVGDDDERVTTALRYASSLACAAGDSSGASFDEAIPAVVAGRPTDGATARFERDVIGRWRTERAALLKALEPVTAEKSKLEPVEKTTMIDVPDDELAEPGRIVAAPTDRAIRVTPAVDTGGMQFGPNGPNGTPRLLFVGDPKTDTSKRDAKAGDTSKRDAKGDGTSKRDSKASDPSKRDGNAKRDAKSSNTAKRADKAGDGKPIRDAKARRDGKSNGAKSGDGKSRAGKPRDALDEDGEESGGKDVLARILDVFGLELPTSPPMQCPARVGSWRFARDGDACVATLSLGWPDVKLTLRRDEAGVQARCAVSLPDDAVSALRPHTRTPRQRIRVVSAPIGASADDVGEIVLGARVVRLRAGAPKLELGALAPGVHVASEVTIGDATIAVRATPIKGIVLRGTAELFVSEAELGAAWRKMIHTGELGLDRISLVASGPPDRRIVALVRPPRAWAGAPSVVDSLVADGAGDRVRRVYPHGSAIPELGWVNPYDVDRSLGLDGWVHAWAGGERKASAPTCGTLAPPPIATDRVCSRSPLDGVLECRVAVQPQLALAMRGLAARILAEPKPFTGRDTAPVRVAFVALRGDTGEILAQGNLAAGKPSLAYAPADARAEAELVKLRDQRGEADVERVDWNLPIAVGSTLKPIVARAVEQAFPTQLAGLSLTANGHGAGCRRRRGVAVDPIVGHCPPTSLSSVVGMPTTADVHEFLAKSPNWYQAALGLVGIGLGSDAKMTVKDQTVTMVDIAGSDLASWPTDSALSIADGTGSILGKRNLSIAGLRRTPMWTRIEALLGRPLCTLGDRASCERAAARADVCAARALPIAAPNADLRNLVALGPDRIDLYAGDKKAQQTVPVREYFQLLRGSGVHAIGSLAQITDAFGRVVFDPSPTPKLAASWFPAPATGTLPAWSCAKATGRANTVLGADGGLCGVVREGGTGALVMKELAADPNIVIYGAKTGTIDSLADIARNPKACARWNATHVASARLECGKPPLDDSLFVIAFGVVTPHGTIPITLGIQLQRAGKAGATRAVPSFIREIAAYLRG